VAVFVDGQQGPISKRYNIKYMPTIYVVDARGVIRHKGVRGEALDQAVHGLLKEWEGEKRSPGGSKESQAGPGRQRCHSVACSLWKATRRALEDGKNDRKPSHWRATPWWNLVRESNLLSLRC